MNIPEKTLQNHDSVVYIVADRRNVLSCKYTYVGVTNNFKRRLLQHCGVTCGGARYTKRSRQWHIIAIIGGIPSRTAALQLEWAIKHARGCKRKGDLSTPTARRICAIWTVLSKEKSWTKHSPCTEEVAQSLWVWWNQDIVVVANALRKWVHLPAAVKPCVSIESLWDYLYPASFL